MRIVAMFTKFWEPGRVKTRLARTIGHALAADLYRGFVVFLADDLQSAGDQRTFVVSPDDQQQPFLDCGQGHWQGTGQGSGDLGERMQRFFARELGEDHRVIVIGGDCLSVDQALVELAFEQLDKSPVVIGPSPDGGYYLLGLRGQWSEQYECLFRDMDWGTETVLQTTLERLSGLGIDPQLLAPHDDIDTAEDLLTLENRVADFGQPLQQNLRAAFDRIGGAAR